MAQPSRTKRPKQDEVEKAKRIVAYRTKAKLQPKDTTRINKITKPSVAKSQKKTNKMLLDGEKSGFIKINQRATFNEVTGKSTPTKYTVTPKGEKYFKDKTKVKSKDPMQLRAKSTVKKTKAQVLKERSRNT